DHEVDPQRSQVPIDRKVPPPHLDHAGDPLDPTVRVIANTKRICSRVTDPKEPFMPRKINLMVAVLLASGAIAQPREEAVLHVPGRSSGTTAIERNVDRKTIRSGKDNKDPFKKLDRRSAARYVWVKGRLLVIDDSMNDVEMIVEVQEGQCRSARLKKNGRFDVVLPAGSRARLIFQKPGHIIKEVLVDATGLSRDPIIRGEDRKVDFDVIL